MGFADGNMGAINGTRPDGQKDITSCQSEEFWTGVTSGLAAQMVQEVLNIFSSPDFAPHCCGFKLDLVIIAENVSSYYYDILVVSGYIIMILTLRQNRCKWQCSSISMIIR
jgi:hypothetical protein